MTTERHYVKREKDGRVGYVGPLPTSRLQREIDAWTEGGYAAEGLPATPENRKIVNAWQRAADKARGPL